MASVADTGEAAVGARGLTGTAYRGHVFWDSDVFVLPFLAATHPTAARAMLEYRLRRMPGSRAAAAADWARGCPLPVGVGSDRVRRHAPDVPRPLGLGIPIRTGASWRSTIVADVAWAADAYLALDRRASSRFWSGRHPVAKRPGTGARDPLGDDGQAHISGVIGPDEYHEEVDDNAFTNVMVRWNLRRAATLADDRRRRTEVRWLSLASRLVDGYDHRSPVSTSSSPASGTWNPLDMRADGHARPIAADVLLGRERVAQAQVVKQADVLMLHYLVPDAIPAGSLGAEPGLRAADGARKLAIAGRHATLFARAGRMDEAMETLGLASRLDLDDLTGTTAAGYTWRRWAASGRPSCGGRRGHPSDARGTRRRSAHAARLVRVGGPGPLSRRTRADAVRAGLAATRDRSPP